LPLPGNFLNNDDEYEIDEIIRKTDTKITRDETQQKFETSRRGRWTCRRLGVVYMVSGVAGVGRPDLLHIGRALWALGLSDGNENCTVTDGRWSA
jgi:hypothetical protein